MWESQTHDARVRVIRAMGGFSDEVRGKSKVEVYAKYFEVADTETFSYEPDPRYKKYCKSQMVWDPGAEEWVLHYHGHT